MDMTRSITDKTQRIFIGVPLDTKAQGAIDSLPGPLGARGKSLRVVPAENRHLTLAFLGDIQGSDARFLASVFDAFYDRVKRFHYRFSALRRFPNARGRIVALTGVPSEPLQHLFELTTHQLQALALPYDKKKFRPHVTLARLRNPRQEGFAINEEVNVGLDVARVALYRSTPGKSGSIYEILRSASLR
jgi:2'-5' RNA ligase